MDYFCIENNSNFTLEEKRSKFLAFSFFVQNVQNAKNILKNLKKEFADAKHVCYAYNIFDGATFSKSCDDGEPAGSAGLPILQTIKNFGLTNVLVVVVRYFGGVLLGKGGLARAYASSAEKVLNGSGKTNLCFAHKCVVETDYVNFNEIKNLCMQFDVCGVETLFGDVVKLSFFVKQQDLDHLLNACNMLKIETSSKELVRWNYEKDRCH